MRLKEIRIHAFGKFQNLTIEFHDGVNVIYGLNEAGKSTIHKFIEVMFYGFFKAYTKNKQYEDDYEAFIPWDFDGYGGALTFEDQGKVIRLERQLLKGKDKLEVYNHETGENITESYDYNKVFRMVDPAIAHIGHNKITYRNTVSMTQMESKTDEEMITEIKDNMSNLASSHDATISVDRVLEKIDKAENAIGSLRKRTSAYYHLNQEIKALEEERQEAIKDLEVIKDLVEEEHKTAASLRKLEEEKLSTQADLDYIEHLKAQSLLEKAKTLESERLAAVKEAKTLEPYKGVTVEEVRRLNLMTEGIYQLELEQTQTKDRLKQEEEKISKYEAEISSFSVNENDVNLYNAANESVYSYEDSTTRINTIEVEKANLNRRREELEKQIISTKPYFGYGLSALLAIAGMITGTIQPALYVLILVGGLAGYFYYTKHKQYKRENEDTRSKIKLVKNEYGSLEKNKKELEESQIDLLRKQDCETLIQLKSKRDQLLSRKSIYEVNQQRMTSLKKDIVQVKELIEKLKLEKVRLETEIKDERLAMATKLKSLNIENQDMIYDAQDKQLRYQEHIQEIKNIELRLEELLGKASIESLESKLVKTLRNVTLDDEIEIRNKRDLLIEQMLEGNKTLSTIKTRLESAQKGKRTLAEVDDVLKDKRGILKDMGHKLKVYDLMKSTIEQIAIDIQNNFAPVVNETMSKVVDAITGSRYDDIKVNPEMALTIYDNTNHRSIQAESLSAGTIDILYFGLRLAVSEVLTKGKKLPLILDDPFVQYDGPRMEKAIELLKSSGRQVLLFTCHTREGDFLMANNVHHHLIELC